MFHAVFAFQSFELIYFIEIVFWTSFLKSCTMYSLVQISLESQFNFQRSCEIVYCSLWMYWYEYTSTRNKSICIKKSHIIYMNFSFLHTIRFSNYIVVCAFKQSKYPLFQVQLCEVVYLYNQTSFNGNLPQYLQTVKNSKKLNSRTRVLARKMFPLYLRGGSMSGEDELLHVQN